MKNIVQKTIKGLLLCKTSWIWLKEIWITSFFCTIDLIHHLVNMAQTHGPLGLTRWSYASMISSLENILLENPSEAAAIMWRLQMWLRAIWIASSSVHQIGHHACSFSLFWNLSLPELKPCLKKLHLKNYTKTSQFFSPSPKSLLYPCLV